MTVPEMVYSFRAAGLSDALQAVRGLGTGAFHVRQLRRDESGGAVVEIACRFSPREVVAILRQIAGGQMMVETVRPCPLSQNTLERTFGASPLDVEPVG